MGLDKKKLQETLKKLHSRGGGDRWKPAKGKNRIRVVRWREPLADAMLRIIHWPTRGGPFPCVGEGCVTCQESEELKGSSNDNEKTQGRKLAKRDEANLIVLDRTDAEREKKGLQRWPSPVTAYTRVLEILFDANDGECPDIFDPEKGWDLLVVYDPSLDPKLQYNVLAAARRGDPVNLKALKQPPAPEGCEPVTFFTGESEPLPDEPAEQAAAPEPTSEEPKNTEPQEQPAGDDGQEFACEGTDYNPDDGFCKKCERAAACRRKMAHKEKT